MYNIRLDNYISKPQPATSDRIVAAHYYTAWKKGAAGIHEGFDDLADIYPDRTPLDQGFGGYNTSWREPDFAAFCKEVL